MNIALILAGGVGKRTGSDIPKQFIEVNRKPLIVYTLEKFNTCKEIERICVVCVKEWINSLEKYARDFKINKLDVICEGGKSSLGSLKNGLMALNCKTNDYILVHDAVRPFVDHKIIIDNIHVAHEYGVAMAAVDCVETLVYANEDGYAEKMIARDHLQRIQTPQTFRYSVLKKLYDEVDIEKVKEPSVFALYMSMGHPIYCSKGNDKNVKITYPDDIVYFKRLFGT